MGKRVNISDQTNHNTRSTYDLEALRRRFFKRARQEVLRWGSECVDIAWGYYPPLEIPQKDSSDLEKLKLVADRVFLPKARCTGPEFIDSVSEHWWEQRAEITVEDGESPRQAICGFYARYLGASGFCLILEFSPEGTLDSRGLAHIWRVDARSKGVSLKHPEHEGDFYDQFGTYLDLRRGWWWRARCGRTCAVRLRCCVCGCVGTHK